MPKVKKEKRPGDPGWKPTEPYPREPRPDGYALASRYLQWYMERQGIPWPGRLDYSRPARVSFHHGRDTFYAEFNTEPYGSPRDRYYEPPETVLTVPIPEHAFPFPRADLWHAAHQASASLEERYSEGTGYAEQARRAEARANAEDPTGELRARRAAIADARCAVYDAEAAATAAGNAACAALGRYDGAAYDAAYASMAPTIKAAEEALHALIYPREAVAA